jgi:DNA-binding response OmpR family regulator
MMPDPTCDLSVLKGMSVLVVEDAWHVAKAMKAVLEQLGMQVLGPAATALEARRLLATQRPWAALVDVNLKGQMAWDLIDDLAAQDIAVIVMSGYAQLDAPRGRPLTHLQKPFAATELTAALCGIVGRSS